MNNASILARLNLALSIDQVPEYRNVQKHGDKLVNLFMTSVRLLQTDDVDKQRLTILKHNNAMLELEFYSILDYVELFISRLNMQSSPKRYYNSIYKKFAKVAIKYFNLSNVASTRREFKKHCDNIAILFAKGKFDKPNLKVLAREVAYVDTFIKRLVGGEEMQQIEFILSKLDYNLMT